MPELPEQHETAAHVTETLRIPLDRLPRHVAIIMDGNGRWAEARGWPRVRGHAAGADVVRETVTEAARLGIEVLTLYSFSIENWNRPEDEVAFLMDLYGQYLESERSLIMDNNVRLLHLGRRARLPDSVLSRMDKLIADSAANTGLKLCLALNYGGRAEMVDAVRRIAADVQSGDLSIEGVNESVIDDRLYTAGLPDPDLLIRTSGEYRISNFLLWQISYSELHVSEACWPDFTTARFHEALRDYASRDRRFGGLTSPVPSSSES